MDLNSEKERLLKALMEEPTVYTIDVLNNKSLPKELQKKEKLEFEIKPPVMSTLAKMSKAVVNVPIDLMKPEIDAVELLNHAEELCTCIAILAHGYSPKQMPEWYVPFLMDNVTPKEALQMFQELSLKLRTDFFLSSFQVASTVNPMMMMKMEEKKKERTN